MEWKEEENLVADMNFQHLKFLATLQYNLNFGNFDFGDVLLGPKNRQNRGITVVVV